MFEKEKARKKKQLQAEGLIAVDEFGRESLTEKGWEKVAHRIGSLPAGEEFLIELAVLDGHGIIQFAN